HVGSPWRDVYLVLLCASQRNHLLRNGNAVDRGERARQPTVARRRQRLASLADNAEVHLWESQRVLLDHVDYVAGLSDTRLQKLKPCRYCREEIAHRDACARGRSCRDNRAQHTLIDIKLCPQR